MTASTFAHAAPFAVFARPINAPNTPTAPPGSAPAVLLETGGTVSTEAGGLMLLEGNDG